ncbi:MAG: hypothetical protein ACTSPD_10480 [Promethearchaeota archaeon]
MFWQDYKFWLFVINLITMFLSGFAFIIIQFVGLKQLKELVAQIVNRLTRIEKKQTATDKALGIQIAICNERHSKNGKMIVGRTGKKKIKIKRKSLKKS